MTSPTVQPLTRLLAQYVTEPSMGQHEAAACAAARRGLIDTVACTLAGRGEPVVEILRAHLLSQAGAHEAPDLATGTLLPASAAACINGTAGHALDYDDVAMTAHPSTVLAPALLAEGHRLASSGLAVLRAYVVGFETWAELYRRESEAYHLKGWHPTGVFGTVAAAGALAHLHRLSTNQAQAALGLAASMASGLVANFGSMTKPLHAGRAAANAIEAVRLARAGMTASPDALEHRAGFLLALSPSGKVDLARPLEAGVVRPRLLEIGLSLKRYPVCYACHRVIDGVLALRAQHGIEPQRVQGVHVTIGRGQASMLRNSAPRTALEAKFSIQFAVASALVAGDVGLAQLHDDFVMNPEVRALFPKVRVDVSETQCPVDPAFGLADRVRITTLDGLECDSGEIRFAEGSPARPLGEAQLGAKFLACAAFGKVPADDARRLYAQLMRLEGVQGVRDLAARGELSAR